MKKLLLSLFAVMSVGFALCAQDITKSSYTCDYLAQINEALFPYKKPTENMPYYADAIEIRYGNYNQRALHDGSAGTVQVCSYQNKILQILGLMQGNLPAQFTVSGKNVILNEDGQWGAIFLAQNMTHKTDGQDLDSFFDRPQSYRSGRTTYYRLFALKGTKVDDYGNYTVSTNNKWTGTIKETPAGIQIDFGPVRLYELKSTSNSSFNSNNTSVVTYIDYNLYSIIIPRYNGVALDTYQNDNANTVLFNRLFQTNIKFTDDNNFEITNLANRGYAIKNKTVNDAVGIGSYADGWLGHVDWDNNKIYLNSQHGASDITALQQILSDAVAGTKVYPYTLTPVRNYDKFLYSDALNDPTDTRYEIYNITGLVDDMGKEVEGTILEHDVAHHEDCQNYWEKDAGGDLVTEEYMWFELEPFALVNQTKYYNGTSDWYYGPWFAQQYEFSYDVTHSVKLTINTWGKDDTNGIYFEATVTDPVNHKHVDDYDIYIIPKAHKSIATFSSNLCTTHGHEKGLLLDDSYDHYMKRQSEAVRKVNHKDKFISKLIPAAEVKQLISDHGVTTSSDKDFSLYLRAKYSHDNLTQNSFHALTPATSAQQTTSVNDVCAGVSVGKVTVNGCDVTLEDTDGFGLITSMTGQVIYQGGDDTVTLVPGLYIIKANTTVQRVLVK